MVVAKADWLESSWVGDLAGHWELNLVGKMVLKLAEMMAEMMAVRRAGRRVDKKVDA